MNIHGRVEVAGLVFVGSKLLHDTGVTVWAVFCHNHQFLLDYTFIFLFSVSLILSGYISSYMFLWMVLLGYLKWQIKRSVSIKRLVLSEHLNGFGRLVWEKVKMDFSGSILERVLGGILLKTTCLALFAVFTVFYIFYQALRAD